MATVQFRSSDEVLSAFENIAVPVWSLWDNKRLMFKGEGADELESFLDLMGKAGGSNAVYTLAYYETITDKKLVNNKTAFDGSFNFRLNSDQLEVSTGQYRHFKTSNDVESRMSAIESKLDELLEPGETEQDNGVIGQIMSSPAIASALPMIIQNLLGSLFPSPAQGMRPVVIGNVPQPFKQSEVSGIEDYATETVSLNNAIERLKKADPQLAAHLNKLADMAEKEPVSFKYILSALDQRQ